MSSDASKDSRGKFEIRTIDGTYLLVSYVLI